MKTDKCGILTILIILCLTVALANAETFLEYLTNKPDASSVNTSADKVLILQGGAVKKAEPSKLPISTATQSALDGKSSTSHNHTGTYQPVMANYSCAGDAYMKKFLTATGTWYCSTPEGGTGAVTSVDGQTGAVDLSSSYAPANILTSAQRAVLGNASTGRLYVEGPITAAGGIIVPQGVSPSALELFEGTTYGGLYKAVLTTGDLSADATYSFLNDGVVSANGASVGTNVVNIKLPPYSAKLDGQTYYDGAATTTTFNSYSTSFTPADVGKIIIITGAGTGGTKDFATNISAYVDAHTVTIGSSVTTSISHAKFTYGTDDTTAWQNALDDWLTSTTTDTIYMPNGTSLIAQLTMPTIDCRSFKQKTLRIMGDAAPPTVPSVTVTREASTNGSIIQSYLTAGTGAMLYGGAAAASCSFNSVKPILENIVLRLPIDPAISGVDFQANTATGLDNVTIDTGNYTVDSLGLQSTNTSFGLKTPNSGNGAFTDLGRLSIIGFYNGLRASEHVVGNEIHVAGTRNAVVFDGGDSHASHFNRVLLQHNINNLVGNAVAKVTIDQYDSEAAVSGNFIRDYDVLDPSNYLYGVMKYHIVQAGTGNTLALLQSGGSNFKSAPIVNFAWPINAGGTGQTTQQSAINALTNASAATNEYVLTKDTATGNAIFKASGGGTTISGTTDGLMPYYDSGTPGWKQATIIKYDDALNNIGINNSDISAKVTIGNDAPVSGGALTVSYTANSTSITISSSTTLKADDILVDASNGQVYFVIDTGGTGTSFSIRNPFNATVSGSSFNVYRKAMVVESSASAPIFTVIGGTGAGGTGSVGIGYNGEGGGKDWISRLSVVDSGSNLIKAINSAASSTSGGAGAQMFADDGAALATSDRLGFLIFGGSADANHTLINSASVEADSRGPWTTSSAPSSLIFKTTATDSVTRAERLRIDSNTTSSSGKVVCWKQSLAGGGGAPTLGYCSSIVGADGSCTCN